MSTARKTCWRPRVMRVRKLASRLDSGADGSSSLSVLIGWGRKADELGATVLC